MPVDIDHPILGKLSWNTDLSTWETKTELRPTCPINLRISTQTDMAATDNLDSLLESGVGMLAWARETEHDCRERIADELLELYNDSWAPEDSTSPMNRAEFMKRLVPSSLVRDIDGSGFFYWLDGDLFAGHWIEVRFDEGYAISEIGLAG
jgi:hypothetical protein